MPAQTSGLLNNRPGRQHLAASTLGTGAADPITPQEARWLRALLDQFLEGPGTTTMTIDELRDRLSFYSLNGYISSEDLWLLTEEVRDGGQRTLACAIEDYDLAREDRGYPSASIWTLVERHYEDELRTEVTARHSTLLPSRQAAA